ncbi:hypothetical protein DV532_29275 (plasmid) [Pseudomonas sp. Leaf58]|nr:hypothetical protein DV532_29275 [Pseudomonas sp. Leaf58]KQN62116.1 hypothetical protein ASF02_08015 [Pseudomonas sp. Leaf58]
MAPRRAALIGQKERNVELLSDKTPKGVMPGVANDEAVQSLSVNNLLPAKLILWFIRRQKKFDWHSMPNLKFWPGS